MKAERYRWQCAGQFSACAGCGTMVGARSSCIDVWLAIHVYTNFTLYTPLEEFEAPIFILRELSTRVVCCRCLALGGNSLQPTQRCYQGLILDLCTVFCSSTFVISFSSSGWWIVANYCPPVRSPQLCVALPLILHIFALLISPLANFICHLRRPFCTLFHFHVT